MIKQILSTVLLALLSGTALSQLIINEYCASNRNGLADVFGEYEDWFEIYNPTGSAVDITGWHISDRATNPMKWQIPSGSVPPNGYLVVFCSGRGIVSGGQIHAGLKITQTKPEDIVLADAVGNVVDQLTCVNHQLQHSVGRTTDGATTWGVFTTPTPNASNSGAFNNYTATPTFDMAPGNYSGSVTLNISTTDPNATVHYTTNGNEPTTGDPVASAPISVSTTTVVRARAFSSDPLVLPSFIETNTYFIGVSHTMPVVSISGDGLNNLIEFGMAWGNDPVGSFEYFDAAFVLLDEGQGHYNKHGNDSWAYDQRGFDFIMRDEFGYNYAIQYPIFRTKNREEFQRVMLKAAANDNYPFEDGAHIRDSYVHSLSHEGELELDERTFEPVILYLNGRYWGVYDIREKVDDHDFTEYYYQQGKFDLYFLKTWGGTWEEYSTPAGAATTEWNALRGYIAANNMSVQANFDYVDSLFNWKSLIDYFVLNSYVVCMDWLNWNTAWWRGLDPSGNKKKWRYALWDMDATFGHYINYTGIPNQSPNADPCDPESLPDPGGQGHTDILNKLMENPMVEQYYQSRFIDLSNTVFSCNNMIGHLDSLINLISPEMQGQINKWGGTLTGWQGKVQELRDFINDRCAAFAQGMIDCYGLSGPYDLTFDVQPAGAGEIKVNSIWLGSYPFSGTYFGNIDILLQAQANAGYVFDSWEAIDPVLPSVDSTHASIQVISNQTIVAKFVEIGDPTFDGLFIPSAFSPNADGNHDWFYVIAGANVANVNIKIFNRWGEQMYGSSDPTEGWNGTYKGAELNTGVYTYIVDAVYDDGTSQRLTGNITLIR